jgi:hypothetical protein
MIAASLYIIACSARNHARVRLRRLREPRYLVGAVVGAAYMYFTFFASFRRQMSGARRRPRAVVDGGARGAQVAALTALGPALAGLGLLAAAAAAWVLPFEGGLLDFSSAEIQFLFPAPVSRRWLLVHRLVRSQLGMLFGCIVVGVLAPSLGGYARLRIGVGVWLLMCAAKMYFTGVTLARARLGPGTARNRRLAWLPAGLIAAAVLVVAVESARAFGGMPADEAPDLVQRLTALTGAQATRVVLAPFAAIASPMFAAWPGPYLLALLASAAVFAVTTAWVLLTDEAFQEVAAVAGEQKARSQPVATSAYRVRGGGWRLDPTGRPETVFVWKAAMRTLRTVDARVVIRLAAITTSVAIAGALRGSSGGLVGAAGGFAMISAVFAVLLGPQMIRMDVRDDLQHLELLKTWPVPASAVVRGELVWPAVLISTVALSLMAVALALSGSTFPHVHVGERIAYGVAGMAVAPGLVLAQLAIQNAGALIFPAWVPLGNQRARGLDAMGQRIITLGGAWLVLAVLALPGVLAGGTIWFVFRRWLGPFVFVPAAGACAAVLLVEALLATEALGPAYERLDIMAIERLE